MTTAGGVKLAIAAGFVLAVGLAFVFGFRAGRHAWRLRMASEPIRPWMSVPFIAHAHHVEAQRLFDAIRAQPAHPRDRRPLRVIARQQHRPVQELIRELDQAIARARAPAKAP